MGARSAMACTVAVETVITEHYNDQLQRGTLDASLSPTIETFRNEEMEHHDIGLAHDAQNAILYTPLTAAIRSICRGAIWLSARV
jgi:ubiquinone biosynthesis monooxygenase Coq7